MRFSSLILLPMLLLLPSLFSIALGDGMDIPFAPPMPSFVPPMPNSFNTDDFLSFDFYDKSCPDADSIIENKVKQWMEKDPTIGPSLIKLHYVDCAITGCDASILLNHNGSERKAAVSKSLRGFEVIDDIKAELEKKCPKTVSCADILAQVARDATFTIGGPFWEVAHGRRDGLESKAEDTNLLPMGKENITYLIEFFESKGLGLIDLVVLSGAHTIGRATCKAVQDRIFNFKGTGKPDPSIEAHYLDYLKRKCRWASDYVDLDATSPTKFDAGYYQNLQKKMGLLTTDQLLYTDSRTSPLVSVFATNPWLFRQQFSVAMMNLGDTQVLTGDDEGEIRVNCNYVNAK